jgi:hypothetical protein
MNKGFSLLRWFYLIGIIFVIIWLSVSGCVKKQDITVN